jgi:hypothetical protein
MAKEIKIDKLKIAVISGASHAIRYKELNPYMTEGDVIRYISSQADKIISKIDKEI